MVIIYKYTKTILKYIHYFLEEVLSLYLGIQKFKNINWHCGSHWPQYIRTFGMPWVYSTSRWEAKHQVIKSWKEMTNNHNLIKDICSQEIKNELLETLLHEEKEKKIKLGFIIIINIYIYIVVIINN